MCKRRMREVRVREFCGESRERCSHLQVSVCEFLFYYLKSLMVQAAVLSVARLVKMIIFLYLLIVS